MPLSRRDFVTLSATLAGAAACRTASGGDPTPTGPAVPGLPEDPPTVTKLTKSEAEWKALLPPQGFDVLRKAGTERAFTGRYWNQHEPGRYLCAACGLHLFDAAAKFDSGTGWPSFSKPVKPDRVTERRDVAYGMVRTEVVCARCEGHLGHVFDDGPGPTGLRYCMNGVSLWFVAAG